MHASQMNRTLREESCQNYSTGKFDKLKVCSFHVINLSRCAGSIIIYHYIYTTSCYMEY